MSLLMDALKKAELAKSQTRPGSPPPAEHTEPTALLNLSLEPIEPTPDTAAPQQGASLTAPLPEIASGAEVPPSSGQKSSRLPDLPENLRGLDEQFIAHHTAQSATPRALAREHASPPGQAAPGPAQAGVTTNTRPPASQQRAAPTTAAADGDRAVARNLFETKKAAPATNRTFAIGIGIVTLLSALGIGGYFWWQLQPKGSVLLSRAAPPVAAIPPGQAPVAAVAGTAPTAAPAQLAPGATASAQPAVPSAPTFRASANKTSDDDDEEDSPPARKRIPAASAREAAPPAPGRAADRMIQTTRKPLQLNPLLARGYELFNRGDYAAAHEEYQRMLAAEPQNTDALHGLAAIAVRGNHPEAAEQYYRRIMIADPKDAVALSGLLNLRSTANPGSSESQLKALAAAQPELAAPHVALGNLYSAQSRWNEAQQAYFNAYASEPENPDLLFNLAVSLEHLRKPELALQYYKQALAAASRHPAGFDPAQARERLFALQP